MMTEGGPRQRKGEKMDSRALLERLIAFETVSCDSNLALIEFIRDYLAGLGVESELIYSDDGRKANLWATIGPRDQGGVILSGHTDVVPVEGQRWTVPPFELTQRDGKLYGRGTADMKGFIACVLSAVPAFLASPLRRPVHIALSYDEEVGCLGVRSLIEVLQHRSPKPIACIIGEPTQLKPVLGHKGKLGVRCKVRGLACHSAYTSAGVNAIEYAANIVVKLNEIAERLKAPSLHDVRFEPPHSTLQVGVIKGGQALNIVPSECSFDWEVRTLPDQDAHQVVKEVAEYASSILTPRMREVSATCGIHFQPLVAYPGLATETHSEVAKLIATLADRQEFGTISFGTEGGLFQQAGVPTVVCGPGCMDQGHKPDEFIEAAQLDECDTVMSNLAEYLRER